MRKFKLTVEMGNAAFADADERVELAAVLRRLAGAVETGDRGVVVDTNGNTVGRWTITGWTI